jgi:hypothetical protein
VRIEKSPYSGLRKARTRSELFSLKSKKDFQIKDFQNREGGTTKRTNKSEEAIETKEYGQK